MKYKFLSRKGEGNKLRLRVEGKEEKAAHVRRTMVVINWEAEGRKTAEKFLRNYLGLEGVVKQMSGAARNEAETEGNKKNRTVIILAVIFAVVVIALVGIIICLLNRGDGDDVPNNDARREVAGSVRAVIDEDSAGNVIDQMREEVAEGMFECQMSMTWTFADGKAESQDAYVANSANNTHPIYFDVYMQDTEELLYSSPVLPVGTDLTNIKLNKELPAGSYQAIVMYSLLEDADSQKEISKAGFVVTIDVQN